MSPTPQYVERLLPKDKRAREIYAQNVEFFLPVIRSFRFLCDQQGFKIKEITSQRREKWITFVKQVPMPIDESRSVDTFVEFTIESENQSSIYGDVSAYPNESHNQLNRISFDDLAKVFLPEFSPSYEGSEFCWKQQLSQIRSFAEMIDENFLAIIDRLAKNIDTDV